MSCVACEDTRQTQRLLAHFNIHKPLISYHEHNEEARSGEIVERIRKGESVALVSDAGTPLVSDPGYRAVNAVLAADLPVLPVPGPSAFVAALTASGLPGNEFRFIGFLPSKQAARRRVFQLLDGETATTIAYESPHRIVECLSDMAELLSGRPLVVARELTKLHEEFLRGTPEVIHAELNGRPSIKGEFTLVIGRQSDFEISQIDPVEEVFANEAAGMARMDAIKLAAKKLGLPKREVYRLLSEAGQARDNS